MLVVSFDGNGTKDYVSVGYACKSSLTWISEQYSEVIYRALTALNACYIDKVIKLST